MSSSRIGREWARVALLACVVMTVAPSMAGDEADAPVQRPAYTFLPQNEDWSVLDGIDPSQRKPFDIVKFVPLNRTHSLWASFGGSARVRIESWSDFAFGIPSNADDTFALWRFMAHADFHFGKRTRLFIQGKSALSSPRDLPGGERTIDADTLDLQQGFVDLAAVESDRNRVVFRLGRRGLQFGKQRLVSPLPWGNTLRAWDGASAILNNGPWSTTAFWTRPVLVRKTEFNRPDPDRRFFGAYATRGGPAVTDLYLLGLQQDGDVMFNGTTGPEQRYTLGWRHDFKLGLPWVRGETELAIQAGEMGPYDIFAWMATIDVGASREHWAGSPAFRLVVDLASGDRAPGGDVQTFNQLYPLGHAYLGIMDFIGRQNIAALSLPMTFRLQKKWKVVFVPYLFRRFETADAMYNAGGGVVFPGDAGSSRDIGTEVDVVVVYKINDYLVADGGYGHFFAGDFVEQAGGQSDMDFAYLQLEFRF